MTKFRGLLLSLLVVLATVPAAGPARATTTRHVCNVHAVTNGYFNCTWTTNVAATLSDYRAAILAGGSRVLVVIYEDINYGGEVTMLYVGSGCQDDPGDYRDVSLDVMWGGQAGVFGWWYNRVSSIVNGNDYPNGAQCYTSWYKTDNQTSSYFTLAPDSADRASMPTGYNDQVKWIQFYGSGLAPTP